MQALNKSINNGAEKLRSELDVVKILNSIRNLEVLTQLMMTEHQITLWKFIKSNTLNSESLPDNQIRLKRNANVKKLGNDVVLPVMNWKEIFIRKHFLNINSFLEDCFVNKSIDTKDQFLIESVLAREPHSNINLAKFSDLAEYTDSEEVDKAPEEQPRQTEFNEDEENKNNIHNDFNVNDHF